MVVSATPILLCRCWALSSSPAQSRQAIRDLGYVADVATKQLVIVPEEAEIVRGMFDHAAGGMLPATIAMCANEKRLVDKNGKAGSWSGKAVLRILRNATIADEVGIANWVESWRRIHAREAERAVGT